jgi:hypothetical protein
MNVWVHSKWRILDVSSLRVWEKLLKNRCISSHWVRYIFRPQWGRYLNREMASSVLEWIVNHTHGDVTSIFPVLKQKKMKTFLANYRSFASTRLQNTVATVWPFPSHCLVRSCSQTSVHPFRYDNARSHLVPRHLLFLLTSNWRIYYNRWNIISTRDQISVRKPLSLSWKEFSVLEYKVTRNHFSGSHGIKIKGTMKTTLV